MMRLPSAVASVAILTIVLVGIVVIAGSGLSRATPESHGDLLLDWAIGDNTDVAVGTIDTSCKSFTAGTVVRIDVIADNANDWAGMDFVFIYPVGAGSTGVTRPGPGDDGVDANPDFGDAAAGFDFVPFDGSDPATFGSNNLMSSAASSAVDYSTTEAVTDGASPHGVSLFDNALVGESGDGGIARISLNTTGLSAGVHTLSLGLTGAFAGGVHSDASGFVPDNAPTGTLPVTFASVQMAVDESCTPTPATPTQTTTPGPGATLTPGPGTAIPAVGGAPVDGGDGNGWPIVAIVVGGVLLGVAAAGAIAQRLRRRTSKTQ